MASHSTPDSTLGAAYIGVVLAATLYGVSCSQVFYYFQHYSGKDGRGTKAIVVATLLSDTIHQILIAHAVYVYTITDFNAPEKLGTIVWSIIVEIIFNGITALLVQSFYAARIWKFSQGNVLITLILAIFIVAEFVCTILYVVESQHMTTFAELAALRPLSIAVNVLGVAGDVLITAVFCTLLLRTRNGFHGSNTMINMLIAFSVQTGLLTSISAIGSLVSTLAWPNTFIYICFYFLLGRLYCNSLLGTLNVREMIREKGHNDLGISLHPIDGSNMSTGDHHKINIKVETVGYITGDGDRDRVADIEARSHDGSSQSIRSTSKATPPGDEIEYELKSGEPRHTRLESF